MTNHSVSVEVLHVEIACMRIGPKQVTLSMFRQFPYLSLVDFDVLWQSLSDHEEDDEVADVLSGELWGHVNYWWKDDSTEELQYLDDDGKLPSHLGEKRHVVYVFQGVLYRSVVYQYVPQWFVNLCCEYTPGADVQLNVGWRPYWERIAALPQLFIAV
jgi:hypothetical protein